MSSSPSAPARAGEETPSLAAIGTRAPVAIHTFSSQFASAASTLTFYPFDVMRTRYMSQDGTAQRQHNGQTYHSMWRSFHTIRQEEGLWKLFKGSGVAVCGSIAAWGLYMFIYRELCNWTEATGLLGRGAMSIIASGVSTCCCSPIFLIKSRMQIEEAGKSSNYRTFFTGVRHIVSTSGVRTLWRGVSLQLLLIIPYAFGVPLYDALKKSYLSYRWERDGMQRNLNLVEVCGCSAVSKLILLTITHPLLVLKVRIQDQRAMEGKIKYANIHQAFMTSLRTTGIKGFYRGFGVALCHTLPRSLLQYMIYEKTLNLLCDRYQYAR